MSRSALTLRSQSVRDDGFRTNVAGASDHLPAFGVRFWPLSPDILQTGRELEGVRAIPLDQVLGRFPSWTSSNHRDLGHGFAWSCSLF